MSDELTEDQITELGDSLQSLRSELETRLAAPDDDTKPVSLDLPIGRLTRMDAMQQQSMAKANRRDQALRLRQVLTALEALTAGAYGACVRCEEPVGYARLSARPETRLCRDCQEALESSRR